MGSMKKSAGTVWGVSSPDIAYYRMLPTKSTEDGQKVLGTYSGIAVVDGYAVYEVLARAGPDGYAARAGPQFRLAHCWAHVKRKFDEASEHYPQACSEVLRLIGELYEVEREVPGPFPGDEKAQKLRLRLRKQRSQRILKAIRQWGESQRGLPRSDFGKAVRYMLERWETLTLFAENPLVWLDNNHAERALRGPVVGRKNHYGSRSKRGTDVAALFYTLCETAKLQNVDPRAYMLEAAYAAINQPGTVLLPDALRDNSAAWLLLRIATFQPAPVGHGEELRMISQRNLSLLSNRLARDGGRRVPERVLERDYCLARYSSRSRYRS